MSGRSKRRYSQSEKEALEAGSSQGHASQVTKNDPKSQKNVASPEADRLISLKFRDMIRHVENRDLDKALIVVRHLHGKPITPFQKRVTSLVTYLCQKSGCLVGDFSIIHNLVTAYPYEYSFRLIRFHLELSMCRFKKMDDAIVLKTIGDKNKEISPKFDFPKQIHDMKKEERSIHIAQLETIFPHILTSKKEEMSVIESMKDFFSCPFTHPLGSFMNRDCLRFFRQKNKHLKGKVNDCEARKPVEEKKKSVSVSSSKGSKSKSVMTRKMAQSEKAKQDEIRKRQLETWGYDSDPWARQKDYTVKSSKAIEKRVTKTFGEMVKELLEKEKKNFLPVINPLKFKNAKFNAEDVKDWNEIYSNHEEFSSLLEQVAEAVSFFRSISEVTEYCANLKRDGSCFETYFCNYITVSLDIVQGNLTGAEMKVDSAISSFVYPNETDNDSNVIQLYHGLENSFFMLKSVISLSSGDYETCFQFLEKIIDTDPSNDDAHNLFVKTLIDDHHESDAIAYMKQSTFVISMHVSPIHTIFGMMTAYYGIKDLGLEEALNYVKIQPFVSMVEEMKECETLPFEFHVWLAAITLELLLKAKGNPCDLTLLHEFVSRFSRESTSFGSISDLMRRTVKAIKKRVTKPRNQYIDFVSAVQFKAELTVSEREENVFKFIRSRKWNFLISRFLHDYLVQEWIRVVSGKHEHQLTNSNHNQ